MVVLIHHMLVALIDLFYIMFISFKIGSVANSCLVLYISFIHVSVIPAYK